MLKMVQKPNISILDNSGFKRLYRLSKEYTIDKVQFKRIGLEIKILNEC